MVRLCRGTENKAENVEQLKNDEKYHSKPKITGAGKPQIYTPEYYFFSQRTLLLGVISGYRKSLSLSIATKQMYTYKLVLRRCLTKFDSSLVYCPDFGVWCKTSEIRTLQNV